MPAPGAPAQPPGAEVAVTAEHPVETPSTAPQAAEVRPSPERLRKRRSKGAISPVTGLSADYQDRKEVGAVIRIFLAVALTAGIVFGVFLFLKKKISEPVEPPAPGLVLIP